MVRRGAWARVTLRQLAASYKSHLSHRSYLLQLPDSLNFGRSPWLTSSAGFALARDDLAASSESDVLPGNEREGQKRRRSQPLTAERSEYASPVERDVSSKSR